MPPGLPTPPVYCIGPLIKSEEVGVKHGEECLSWLDSQPKDSVVFLCFGSLGMFGAKQIREIAVGQEVKFQKMPEPDLDALLPEGFLDRTKGTGLIVKSWAPQHDVLAHDAVGGFVTHCGWNSILESVMAGVPMLAWPLYVEHRINRVFLEKELGLAVAVEGYDKDVVQANEVASKVSWIVDSDGGRLLRERTLVAMRQPKEAMRHGGESDLTFARMLQDWMLA
ncbi:hypothetical protein ACQ4PT_021216 [Festuca glaucescens]